MKKFDYTRSTPPGTDTDSLRSFFRTEWAFFALFLLVGMGLLLLAGISGLNQVVKHGQADAATRIAPYWALLRRCLRPHFVVLPFAIAAAQVINSYRFYRRGSRADYTMRRLPDRREYHRRCWAAPIHGLLGTAFWCAAAALVMAGFYFLFTPKLFHPSLF